LARGAVAAVAVATPLPLLLCQSGGCGYATATLALPKWLWLRHYSRHSATGHCGLATVAPAAAFLDGCSR